MASLVITVKELKLYTRRELESLFPHDIINELLKDLKTSRFIKLVNESKIEVVETESSEADVSEEEQYSGKCGYVFTFVGILIYKNILIKSTPKYIEDFNNYNLKKIIKVLKKYGEECEPLRIFTDDEGSPTFNRLALIHHLLEDYFENGLYTADEDIVEVNGEGNILWYKTINETLAYIQDNQPYYFDMYTKRVTNDEDNFFIRLHKAVLMECYDVLKEWQLLELFDFSYEHITNERLDDLGDSNYISYRIFSELSQQFNTRKQRLLKALDIYVRQKDFTLGNINLSFYATTHFHTVWETVCSKVLGDCKDTQLSKLPIALADKFKHECNKTLLDLIPKPQWTLMDDKVKEARETLRPDTILVKNNDFIICDAKYYSPRVDSMSYCPGVGDISKQFLYQLSYKDFIEAHNLQVQNCFLMPIDIKSNRPLKTVSFPIFQGLSLKDIDVHFLDADEMYDLYLSNKKTKEF